MNKHVAFFPINAKAHIQATVPIAQELIEKGYRVTYVVTEQYADEIRSIPADPVFYSFSEEALRFWDQGSGPADPKNWESFLLVSGALFTQKSHVVLRQVMSFFEKNPPDLVMYDVLEWSGKILSILKSVPAIQVFCHLAMYNNFFSRENYSWATPIPGYDYFKKIDFLYSTLVQEERLNLCLYPPSLQFNREGYDESFKFVGGCYSRKQIEFSRAAKNKRNHILVALSASQGPDYEYFSFFIDYFASSPWRVTLSVGKNVDVSKLGDLPDNLKINQVGPQSALLKDAALFVGSGGMVSTLEAILYEVPMILIPPVFGPIEVAYRAQELGIGVVVKRDELDRFAMDNAIASMAHNNSARRKIRKIKDEILELDGTRSVVKIIEEIVADKS